MNKIMFVSFLVLTSLVSWKSFKDVSPEDLIAQWNDAWNKQNASAIANLLDDHVELISGKWRQSGKQNVIEKFVEKNYKLISDLKTSKITEGINANIAFQFGTYTLNQLDTSGKIIGTEAGNFAFVWKKNKKNEWKLTVIEMEEYHSKK